MVLRSFHLRADFGLWSMDALHLATTLVRDCETFITNGQRLARVDPLRRTHPSWSERSDMLKAECVAGTRKTSGVKIGNPHSQDARLRYTRAKPRK